MEIGGGFVKKVALAVCSMMLLGLLGSCNTPRPNWEINQNNEDVIQVEQPQLPTPPEQFEALSLEVRPHVYHQTVSGNLAIQEDGSVWSWWPQVWDNSFDESIDIPAKMMEDAVAVRDGGLVHFVLQEDGSLWGWGYDEEIGGAHEPILIMENVRLPY